MKNEREWRLRIAGWLFGGALIAFGLFMPTGWYHPAVRAGVPDPPFSGLLLLRLVWILEGLAVMLIATGLSSLRRLPESQRLLRTQVEARDPVSTETATRWLVALTLLAAALRFAGIGSDLWLDEIAPLRMYRDMPPAQILVSYVAANNHLLNTLLVRLSTTFLGETEFAVRLPAVLFGIATVPALYRLTREVADRRTSLVAAGLLSVSYHHIWFSQNARGYSAYLCLALISCTFLLQALRTDRGRDWLGYVVSTLLMFSALLMGLFLIAAQVLTVTVLLMAYRRSSGEIAAPLAKLLAVYIVLGLLCVHVYAAVVPQAYALISVQYTNPNTAASLLSLDFVRVFAEGLTGLTGSAALVVLAVVVALTAPVVVAGLWEIWRRSWPLLAMLGGALLLQAVLAIMRNLVIAPRMVILALPLGVMVLSVGLHRLGRQLWERVAPPVTNLFVTVAVAVCAVALAAPLATYYQTPKQDYRGSLRFLAEEAIDGDVVVALHLMEHGYRFYAHERGPLLDIPMQFVRDREAFEEVIRSSNGRRVLVVSTLNGYLRSALPEVWETLRSDFDRIATFPGTLGDGTIVIWSRPAG